MEVKLYRTMLGTGKGTLGLYKYTWKWKRSSSTVHRSGVLCQCVCLCVPAEDRSLVFSVHSESDGLLAGHRAHRLRGDGLAGRRIFLGLVVVAVRAVGRRAVWSHQGGFPRHAHAPHARCRRSDGRTSTEPVAQHGGGSPLASRQLRKYLDRLHCFIIN